MPKFNGMRNGTLSARQLTIMRHSTSQDTQHAMLYTVHPVDHRQRPQLFQAASATHMGTHSEPTQRTHTAGTHSGQAHPSILATPLHLTLNGCYTWQGSCMYTSQR
uniref:Uncharacterized protein n=1 Tax=Haptolina ericina TaxID=156174 RepID=A0A7S3F7E0_9EUKA|mmetsp:Transcript_56050/g.125137  ORF Transcript_56050/g.125137 Transcript_56050/m.125137 type:complete len:106 (+) Transcript_56050:361-678(+)